MLLAQQLFQGDLGMHRDEAARMLSGHHQQRELDEPVAGPRDNARGKPEGQAYVLGGQVLLA